MVSFFFPCDVALNYFVGYKLLALLKNILWYAYMQTFAQKYDVNMSRGAQNLLSA